MKTIVDQFGRIMLPLAIRERMNIPVGSIVEFVETEHGLIIRPTAQANASEGAWRYESEEKQAASAT